MPKQIVEVRRWQIGGAFVVFAVICALVIWWEDGRIDHNTHAIARAEALAAAATQANVVQNRLRRERVHEFQQHDLELCQEVEALKERIRATVLVNDQQFLRALGQLGIQPQSTQAKALLSEAHARERETLARFTAIDCRALVQRK